jgi:hypothetical protein
VGGAINKKGKRKMNKGTVSDIKPGMLVKLEVSAGPDLGIVYHADTDIFNVLLLDNSGVNIPTCVGADEIICAWNLSQIPTYGMSDLLQGCIGGWKSILDIAVVYRSNRPETVEMTLEEISELVSKQLGKPVSISVKDSKPEGVEPRTEVFVVPANGAIDYDALIGEEFEIKGVRYRVIEDTRTPNSSCGGCALKSDGLCGYYMGNCGSERLDGKTILFERVHAEDACKSSETSDMSKSQKTTIATEIHDLYAVEPAIGYIIEDRGKRLKAVECNSGCVGCYFCDDDIEDWKHIICAGRHRKDGKNIILQEVEEEQ